eukprot:CAMPEP_0206137352 /NCGR_PEP_ID=MMETSP1473-20131121/2495_1 /ASSEMBLY_ACC=CAM_ASM_001109 /TAXON_ID=1461547 /ORGANISM="Stichococcus sp, Strain RCC1054" /LENGTH=119 /DNA_ID=CAMNT_0053530399 /DNA_START=333 /DNA_END=690 /DNA_ORIENTATION=-
MPGDSVTSEFKTIIQASTGNRPKLLLASESKSISPKVRVATVSLFESVVPAGSRLNAPLLVPSRGSWAWWSPGWAASLQQSHQPETLLLAPQREFDFGCMKLRSWVRWWLGGAAGAARG